MKPLTVAFLALILGATASWAAASKPNLIVIYTDDHGWPDLGARGIYDDLKTPHIDALAAGGVLAVNGYSSAPQCVPSRAGLLAGKHQSRFGVESNVSSLDGFNAQLTIAERLQATGYATGQIGKWHLGPNPEIPLHGFADVFAKNNHGPAHANFNLEGETIPLQLLQTGGYHLDDCTLAARAFIQRHHDQPFFLYLAWRAPHVPLDAPQAYLDRFPGPMPERRRQALAMIAAMDDGVGRIVETLREHGLEQNTLIFFIGDNGAPLKIHMHDAPGGDPGWDGSLNAPMNGEKGMLSEGGIRVPFVVSWPDVIPPGQIYEPPLISLDVAATALALAGLPPDSELDGVDLIPHLSGANPAPPHEALTWRWISQAAVREGKWKLLRGGEREYLYDLDADPGETTNLLASHPEIASRLRDRLSGWCGELDPPGLATGPMAETWTDYFDFYLDGKPAKPLAEQRSGQRHPGETAGSQAWVARNATLALDEDGALRVTPGSGKGSQGRPFIVQPGLKLKMPLEVRLHLESGTASAGNLGLAWRLDGEKDFPTANTASFQVEDSSDSRGFVATVPGPGTLIHLRILLPEGVTRIQKITLQTPGGKPLETYRFQPADQ